VRTECRDRILAARPLAGRQIPNLASSAVCRCRADSYRCLRPLRSRIRALVDHYLDEPGAGSRFPDDLVNTANEGQRVSFSHHDWVSRATISTRAASARASISPLVWSCIGCGTYTASKSGRLSAAAWARAAVRNSSVATATAGIPKFSKRIVSCKLHVVHDPQSASASITASTV